MADWYVSSVAHAAVPVFAVSTAYTVGQFVRRITSTLKAQWVFRVTVAGTSGGTEPTWPTADNGTVVSGGATFANVTGQSTYGWSVAAGDLPTLLGAVGTQRFQAGDRLFVSSDHSETQTTATVYGAGTAGTSSFSMGQVLSVNRAGSVPPVAADLTAGAIVTVGTGNVSMTLDAGFPVYHYGINYIYTGTSGNGIVFNLNGVKSTYLDNCTLYLNTTNLGVRISNTNPATLILNNTTLRFSHINQCVAGSGGYYAFEILWLNTLSAVVAAGSIPSGLFTPVPNQTFIVTVRGVDLSALTGVLASNVVGSSGSKYLFDSCRIAPGVTRYNSAVTNTRDVVELINCFDGTNIVSESYQPAGAVTTERTITLSGGATDDVGLFSHKMVSNTNIDKYANPLTGFWMDVGYQTVGSSKTATVEIVSGASLNNDEISLLLEYQGTMGSPVATITTSLPATVLTTPAALASSAATWASSPGVAQRLQVTFTPRLAGRVRGQIRLGKPSTTVWYNPVITIT